MLLFWPGWQFISEKTVVICLLPLFFSFDCAAWSDAALCISFLLLCFSSIAHCRVSKKRASSDGRPLARSLAGVTVTHVLYWLTYACLSAACILALWELGGKLIMMPGWCFSQPQLQGGLSANAVLCLSTFHFIIAPEGDAFQRNTLRCPKWNVFVSGPVGLSEKMALNKAVLEFKLGDWHPYEYLRASIVLGKLVSICRVEIYSTYILVASNPWTLSPPKQYSIFYLTWGIILNHTGTNYGIPGIPQNTTDILVFTGIPLVPVVLLVPVLP